jgi:hypothetical protein
MFILEVKRPILHTKEKNNLIIKATKRRLLRTVLRTFLAMTKRGFSTLGVGYF